ncbi:MAG: FlgD immunoglobulin-like domain containing protein [Bacteroidota bacterium]
MKHKPITILFIASLVILSSFNVAKNNTQADTVKAIDVFENFPTIDGIADDDCWSSAKWQSIDQVWINYGELIDSSDFFGNYKVVWSSESNLLYFLVEITDDEYVDGYIYDNDGYYNYDMVEVFVDQDKSGGLHVFDGSGSVGIDWGTNAENAFSYHINVDLPAEGEVNNEFTVEDIAGTDWSDKQIVNYADHFPELAFRKNNEKYYWEFSLSVFNDSYNANNPENSKTELHNGDVLGLSLAYCDNDDSDEEPKERDNFIGSVWVPESNYNDHWMNADFFGTLKLVSHKPTTIDNRTGQIINKYQLFNNYPNPFNPDTIISYQLPQRASVKLKVFDMLGREIKTLVNVEQNRGVYKVTWDGNNSFGNQVVSGIYYIKMESGNYFDTKKMVLLR